MKTSFFIGLFCFLTCFGYAQKHGCPKEPRTEPQQQDDRGAVKQKIRAHKIAFFTDRLSLTPAEAEKFWPMYNAYTDAREQLMNAFFQEICCKDCPIKKGENEVDASKLSDAEALKLINDKVKLFDLEKKLHNDLCKLFSPQRVLIYYCTEREFHRELLRQHSEGNARLRKLPDDGPKQKVRTIEIKK